MSDLVEVTDPALIQHFENSQNGLREETDPNALAQLSAPQISAWQALPNGILRGAASAADATINFVPNVWNLAKAGYGTAMDLAGRPDLAPQAQTQADTVTDYLVKHGVLKPTSSESRFGRVVDFTGSVLGAGGINPASVVKAGIEEGIPTAIGQTIKPVAGGVVGGAAQQGAEAIAPDNGLAQTAAGFAGSMIGHKIPVPKSLAGVTNEALHGVTPQQMQQAQELVSRSYALGTPITGAEAIAQVTGGNPLQGVQRVIEQSGKGSPITTPFMNARPDANEAAFGQTLNQSMGRPAPSPEAVPARLQAAADSAVTAARQQGNAAARPFYQSAYQQSVPAQEWNRLMTDPIMGTALREVKTKPVYGVSDAPEGSIEWIDAAKKYANDAQQSALQSGERNASRLWGQAADSLRNSGVNASPEYAQALKMVAQNRQNVVTPMERSPVGDLQRSTAQNADSLMRAQRSVLMPDAPQALTPQSIQSTIKTLSTQDPNIGREWSRQALQAIFNETTQRLVSGQNQWGAAKYASVLNGNTQQANNLRALLESTGGPQAYSGFRRLLDVFEAQGKRLPMGSQTAQNLEIQKRMSGPDYEGGLPGVLALNEGGAHSLAALKATEFVSKWYADFRYGRDTRRMAEILTSPESVKKLGALANLDPSSQKARALVSSLFASAPAAPSGQPQQAGP